MVRFHSPAPFVEEFPSGQRGQTVNLLSQTSMVRIHPPPPNIMSKVAVAHAMAIFFVIIPLTIYYFEIFWL